MSELPKSNNRLIVLDRLRGFFIIVIVIDHLSRWPSLFSLITGKALLWVTAAEGFVAISGLLVGYVRGFKNQHLPLQVVTKVLLRRALLLYTWSLIAALVYTAIIWYVPLQGGSPGLPFDTGNWTGVIIGVLTLHYPFVWVHFLSLYAVFLAASPIAIWLFRLQKAWIVACISFIVLAIGWVTQSEILQWQFLFFIPSIAGYYLETILRWWRQQSQTRQWKVVAAFVTTTLLTIGLSVLETYYSFLAPIISSHLGPLFEKDTISLYRAMLAFIWFIGFLFIFSWLQKPLKKYFDWLLLPIGTRSLTAYILHGLALVSISFLTVSSENLTENTLLGIAAVLIVWSLIKIPNLHRIIPR